MDIINDRKLIFHTLYNIIEENKYSNIELRKIQSNHQAFITDMVYGILERKATLDFVIQSLSTVSFQKIHPNVRILLYMGIYQLLFMRVKDHAAVYETVELGKEILHKGSIKFLNGMLRNLQRKRDSIEKMIKDSDMDIRYSISKEFLQLLREDFDEQTVETILKDSLEPKYNHVYLRRKEMEIIGFLKQKNIPHCKKEDFLIFRGPMSLLEIFYKAGDISYMDISTSAIRYVIPEKVDRVLELCAAPGGKTTLIADVLPHAEIDAIEIHSHRAEVLERNLKRMGIQNVQVIVADGIHFSSSKPYDLVSIDAPCSGSGVIGRRPELRYKINRKMIKELQSTQFDLLSNAIEQTKAKGTILYSTCSILKKENEEVIEKVTNAFPVTKVKQALILPTDGKEGFYIALLKKDE
ncbi:MAG: transcription antitermination factor NusB [Tissierellia bacterium]|nr:transcription antitermination factor NusB [Tissierellia bacterium]